MGSDLFPSLIELRIFMKNNIHHPFEIEKPLLRRKTSKPETENEPVQYPNLPP